MKEKSSALKKTSAGYKVFQVFNYVFLILLAIVCLVPLLNILAISLSAKEYVTAGTIIFLPKGFTWQAYDYIFSNGSFWNSLRITLLRTVFGVLITTLFTVLLAYPLSRSEGMFRGRKIYMAILIFAMLFSGGMVPSYLLVANTLNLKDNILALILPGSIQVFSVVMMMNFFRSLPASLEEAAFIDGGDHFLVMTYIVLPCSTPILVTVMMFSFLNHWNSWFDGLIYSSQEKYYPLQTYLREFLAGDITANNLNYQEINNDSIAAANIFVIILPIVILYPWLQKYFIQGITLGSVKG